MNNVLTSNPEKEAERIVSFLQKTFQEQTIQHAVIGLSGGIDSTTSLFLLTKALPLENIHVVHMPYFSTQTKTIGHIVQAAQLSANQLHIVSIKEPVEALRKTLEVDKNQRVRLGNIMARVRMITLFDFAKKMNGLVVGTENKSEYHLSYFTRFGDEASDIEPLQHLYKTQVYALAKYLNVPQFVLNASPSAGLWQDQTDEKEFGFSYLEADQVLYRYFDRKEAIDGIQKDLPNARKIIDWCNKNDFKHHVPYTF